MLTEKKYIYKEHSCEKTAHETKHHTLNVVSAIKILIQRAVSPEPCISELFCVFFVDIKKTKVQAEQTQITAHSLSSFFLFQESSLWALSSALRFSAVASCLIFTPAPMARRRWEKPAGAHWTPWSAFVQAQLEKQHRQKRSGIISRELANPLVHVYFLYDPVSGLKEQDPIVSFRIPASLMNTLVLFLIKLFGEGKLCTSSFAPIDLTCVLSGQQRHRDSK